MLVGVEPHAERLADRLADSNLAPRQASNGEGLDRLSLRQFFAACLISATRHPAVEPCVHAQLSRVPGP
jgi:hypothetical protein